MTKRVSTVLFWGVVALLSVYFAASMFPSVLFSSGIEVQPAEKTVYNDYLEVTGIALRDEQVCSYGEYPWVTYEVNNGDRVALGQAVIRCSQREISVADRLSVETLNRRISLLEESVQNTSQYDIVTLNQQTWNSISDYLNGMDGDNLQQTQSRADAVQISFIKKDIRTNGNSSYYSSAIDRLQNERSALLSGNSGGEHTVYAAAPGYFSADCDGYESVRYSDSGQLSVTDLQALLNRAPAATAPGTYKIQHYSNWGFACLMSSADAEDFPVGSTCTAEVDIAGSGTQNLTFLVEHISSEESGRRAVLFRCTFMNGPVYSLRIATVRLIRKTYNGFRLPIGALRMEEDQTGVYVLSGVRLVFKPVRVLFSNDTVAVVAADSASRALSSNDRVVVAGQDIYDGRIVNIN